MNQQDDEKARQARIDVMIAEFEEARRRRLVKIGIALWKRAETMHFARSFAPLLPDKIH